MSPADDVAARRCVRRFTILTAGGVRCVWACGAHRDFPDEVAIDVEFLADHLPTSHHHRHRLPHLHPHHQGASA